MKDDVVAYKFKIITGVPLLQLFTPVQSVLPKK